MVITNVITLSTVWVLSHMSKKQKPLQMYKVTIKDQPVWGILARDKEQAMYSALELANAHCSELIDVSYYEEWS